MNFKLFNKFYVSTEPRKNTPPNPSQEGRMHVLPREMGVQVGTQNPKKVYNMYTDELCGIMVDEMKWIIEFARKGINFYKALWFEEMKRKDLHIGAVCQTRKLAVANKETEIKYKPESTVPVAHQEEILAFINENLCEMNIPRLITKILEAPISGVKAFESIFIPEGGKIYYDDIIPIASHMMCYDDITDSYKFLDQEKADALDLKNKGMNIADDRIDLTGLTIPDMHPYKILVVESLEGEARNGFQNGCIDALMWAYLFKTDGMKDWAIWIDRFAVPFSVGTYPTLNNPKDKSKFMEMMKNIGHLFYASIPEGYKIEFPGDSQKASSTNAFNVYDSTWDKKISLRVIGNVLTMDVGKYGSKSLGQVHEAVRQDIVVADMMIVKDAINEFIRRIINLNFSGEKEYPVWGFREEQNMEYKVARSEIIRNLTQCKYRPSIEDVNEEFDLDVEEMQSAPNPFENPGEPPLPGDTEGQRKYIDRFIKSYYKFINQE